MFQINSATEENGRVYIKKHKNDFLIQFFLFLDIKELYIKRRVCHEWLQSIFGKNGVIDITLDLRLREIIQMESHKIKAITLSFPHKVIVHSLESIPAIACNQNYYFKYTHKIILPIASLNKEINPSYTAFKALYTETHASLSPDNETDQETHNLYLNTMQDAIMCGLYKKIGSSSESQKYSQQIVTNYKKAKDKNVLIIAAIELGNLELCTRATNLIKNNADSNEQSSIFSYCSKYFLKMGRYEPFIRFWKE
ncbi:MAG: hypothetical protein COZ46_04670 [Verrucomicrobia bacterium CG_4_10_14_3_um_filter_43_23]|nr:MAG: hypothetical protein AUJ82_07250 [Verrucomicrobia bacterium CG1_02_43_26]PIP58563.1 MAG: hypothetical protein COX01_07995 [Verrucomicrobia bacterium CG22_combo_CG10-13_8_21_14_all_43_17]PIX58280.1 MAG: hypothetical protein COZ46_04670 [Verrucomicrobia bacterium CG_4_10_14_3_um_filter_43_23]PIY60790.1 MAG: hypothetical protein COY94_08585 [Verrucomicrobia bacterium CG_4_10_14_0_8_um_filter_43_34]PJA43543.1 MAG: hypothetical protein CO175_07540 [Verrucomicrobia bacterium CG_4_9_14_3_um_fi